MHPRYVVTATSGAMKAVSKLADPYIGKSAEVRKSRYKSIGHDFSAVHRRRELMLRILMPYMSSRPKITKPIALADGISIVDNYTLVITDGLSGNYKAIGNEHNEHISFIYIYIYGTRRLCSVDAIGRRFKQGLASLLSSVSPLSSLDALSDCVSVAVDVGSTPCGQAAVEMCATRTPSTKKKVQARKGA